MRPTRRGVIYATAVVAAFLTLVTFGFLALGPPDRIEFSAPPKTSPTNVEETLLPARREPPPPSPPTPAEPPAPPPPLADLGSLVYAELAKSGASVISGEVSIDRIGKVFDRDSGASHPPASTQKIYGAFAGLVTLGPGYTFETKVTRAGVIVPNGTLKGDLYLVGGGDPSLTLANLQSIASSVAASGIRVVEGNLGGDDTRYDRVRNAPGWKPEYLTHEVGSLSALAVDRNEYKKDADFVRDPVPSNLQLFREALQAAGVAVTGVNSVATTPPEAEVVVRHRSAPIKDLLVETLRESDNFYAEMLVKELGHRSGDGSTTGGLAAIAKFASDAGLPFGPSYDGSGLSSLNRQSAAGQVTWLRAIVASPHAGTFNAALAVSCGAEGTLRRRMCGTPAAGRVVAKSGGLPQVQTLSGYTTTASGGKVVFSFVLLGSTSGKHARDAIDAALGHVAAFAG